MSDFVKPIHTEKSILELLMASHKPYKKYEVANAFVFSPDWESDLFIQWKTGDCFEIEIKTYKTDFLDDLKKVKKHSILKNGFYYDEKWSRVYDEEYKMWGDMHQRFMVKHERRPNYFYYCVPEGLVTIDEVPEYAGLIYIVEGKKGYRTKEVRIPPRIHDKHFDYGDVLCGKFYNRWHSEMRKTENLERQIKELQNKIAKEIY